MPFPTTVNVASVRRSEHTNPFNGRVDPSLVVMLDVGGERRRFEGYTPAVQLETLTGLVQRRTGLPEGRAREQAEQRWREFVIAHSRRWAASGLRSIPEDAFSFPVDLPGCVI